MNNFAELNQEELTEVSGGFVVSTAFVIVVAAELAVGAIAATYLHCANEALDAMDGQKYPGVV